MTVNPDPMPTLIRLTPEELESKTLGRKNLLAALQALHQDGLVVLENAVDPEHLDRLNARMVPEAQKLYDLPTTHRNFGDNTGNIQQEPVLEDEFVFQDVVANPWACAITQCMLGPEPTARFYSANTAFPATARQPVHVDVEFDFPQVPFAYCLNVNLVATSPANGATEVWLGTHTDASKSLLGENGKVFPDVLEARRATHPPLQPSLPKGALIIRDIRMWHAGMPNKTSDPRVMLVTVHFARWYNCRSHMVLPESAKGRLEWGGVVPVAEWVDEGYDYLQGAHDHDFTLLAESLATWVPRKKGI